MTCLAVAVPLDAKLRMEISPPATTAGAPPAGSNAPSHSVPAIARPTPGWFSKPPLESLNRQMSATVSVPSRTGVGDGGPDQSAPANNKSSAATASMHQRLHNPQDQRQG